MENEKITSAQMTSKPDEIHGRTIIPSVEWVKTLNDAIQALHRCRGYFRNYDFIEISGQRKALDATIRNLLVAAELVTRIPESVRKESPYVPWEKIESYHQFLLARTDGDGPELESLWTVVRQELPKIISLMMQLRDGTGWKPEKKRRNEV